MPCVLIMYLYYTSKINIIHSFIHIYIYKPYFTFIAFIGFRSCIHMLYICCIYMLYIQRFSEGKI